LIVYLGLGSNIDAEKNINQCHAALRTTFDKVRFSPVYKSKAVGFDGDDFLNSVAEIRTDLELKDLIEKLKNLENELGRVRAGEKFSSRHIDIDILLYGDQAYQQPIVLPREEIYHQAYVLKPLADLAGDMKDPVHMKTYQQLWQDFDQKKQPIEVASSKS